MLYDYNNKNFKIIKKQKKYNIKYINEDIIFSSGFNDTMFTNINFQEDLNKLEENNG